MSQQESKEVSLNDKWKNQIFNVKTFKVQRKDGLQILVDICHLDGVKHNKYHEMKIEDISYLTLVKI